MKNYRRNFEKILDLIQSAKNCYVELFATGGGFTATHGRYKVFLKPSMGYMPMDEVTKKYIKTVGDHLGFKWWNYVNLYQGWEIRILIDPHEDNSPEELRKRTKLKEVEDIEDTTGNISDEFEEEEEI